ncbi:MAG: PAS domain S-box protein, partial [Verrucomicrobiota bacterium]
MPAAKGPPRKAVRLKAAEEKLPGRSREVRSDALELQSRATALETGRIEAVEERERLFSASKSPLPISDFEGNITKRRVVEQPLKESEDNFRVFFETLDDMIFVGNPDGKILFSNHAASRKLGYTPEELRTMLLIDLHPADLREKAEEIVGAMLRGERETCPLPLENKSGGIILVETRVWPGKWDGKDCLFGLCKDITEEEETRQRFELLFRNSPSLLALSTLPERKFVDVNTSFLSTLGYSREEVIGKTAMELGLFQDAEALERSSAILEADGRLQNMELQVRRADGTIIEGLFSAEVIVMRGQRHLLSVMNDVTALNQSARLLQESEGRLLKIAGRVPGVIYQYRLRPDGTSCFPFASEAINEIYRVTPNEVQEDASKVFANLHPDDRDGIVASILKSAQELAPWQYEYRVKFSDGTVRQLSGNAVPQREEDGSVLWHGFITDITERKQADEEIRQLAGRLSLATQAGGVGIWDWDVANDRLVWDDNMYRQYGITRDQFAGAYEAWTAGLHPDDRERGDAEIHMALRGEKDFNTDFRVVWPDGSIHHIRAMALVQRNAAGEPLHLIGTNWDITKQEHAERVVLQNLARAEELTRLKSRFVSMASHELRTPLANIMLACELLKNFGNAMPAERAQSVMSGLMTGVTSMVRTLDDLLLAGKLEEGKLPFTPAAFLLLDFLKRCSLEVQPDLKSPSRIEIGFRDAGLGVTADERLLGHILKNFLENALKYSPAETKIELGVEAGADSLTLSVLDRGIGVPEAERKFLFDAFSR